MGPITAGESPPRLTTEADESDNGLLRPVNEVNTIQSRLIDNSTEVVEDEGSSLAELPHEQQREQRHVVAGSIADWRICQEISVLHPEVLQVNSDHQEVKVSTASGVRDSSEIHGRDLTAHEISEDGGKKPELTISALTLADEDETSSDLTPLLSEGRKSESMAFDTTEVNLGGYEGEETGFMDHCHTERDSAGPLDQTKAKRRLIAAFILGLLFTTFELTGGYFSGSLSIWSDGVHVLTDALNYLCNWYGLRMAETPSSKAYNFGRKRASPLAAFTSIILLYFATGSIMFLAVKRLIQGDYEIQSQYMLILAGSAVLFNLFVVFFLRGVPTSHGHSHDISSMFGHSHLDDPHASPNPGRNINVQAALMHVLGDLFQSAGVLISAVIIFFFPSAKYLDPICSFVFGIVVMITSKGVITKTVHILLEARPTRVSYEDLYRDLMDISEVVTVHNLKIWGLDEDTMALVCHLAVEDPERSEMVLQRATKICKCKHDIEQLTIQVERYRPEVMNTCRECQPMDD
ncbi:hypothetical protein TCAL_07937 [Tigriopus californicus]|uniref:Cation efflux protein cytoplasmic domain-containing protein n=1 Tax=Tigriopus californicus TaxID=6832 RepID=A0A553NFN1_TIGCA|nr:proton-coupled zinc antiporter SLC30A2-like [Tigriopus californicus]TRY64263.1 hypothetical protein TCAL_07937 [Tigriopus californicus]|eukprot:TCALIF_07937-PA protein Name:"Similar to Slc30a2 Zinc transporter 2 (Mus musculus)" AED:0.12 eAED:0.12 QI:0/-1/0/1/-1/1/1/0/519